MANDQTTDLPGSNWRTNISSKLPMVFAGKVLPVVCLLLITVIYSRKLNYHDYGKYQTMWVLMSLCGTVLLFGLPSIMLATPGTSFWPYLKKHRKKIVPVFCLLLITSLAMSWFAADEYNLYQKLFLSLLILLQSCSIVLDTKFIKDGLLKSYILFNTLYALAFFIIHMVFLYQPFSLEKLMAMLVALFFTKLAAGFMLTSRSNINALYAEGFSLTHWLYTGLNEVAGILGRWLDKIVLLYLLSASDFAIYFNGSFEIPLFAVMVSAMENLMLANISQDLANKAGAIRIFKESFKLLSLIAFPVFCFFLFAHQEFYEVIFQNKYDASIPVFIISLFMIPLRITHYGVILQCYGKGNQLLIGSVADIILSLLLMLILYPFLRTLGIMLALVISTYLQVLYYLVASSKILHVKFYELVPLRFLGLTLTGLLLLFYGLSFLRPLLSATNYLVTLFSIATIIVLGSLYQYFLNQRKIAS